MAHKKMPGENKKPMKNVQPAEKSLKKTSVKHANKKELVAPDERGMIGPKKRKGGMAANKLEGKPKMTFGKPTKKVSK